MDTTDKLMLLGGGLVALYLFTRKSSPSSPSVIEQTAGNVGSAIGAAIPQASFALAGGAAQSFTSSSYQSGMDAGQATGSYIRSILPAPAPIAASYQYTTGPNAAAAWETAYSQSTNPLANIPGLSNISNAWHSLLTGEKLW